ncbi:MAG: FkbM family methyltransferase [Planctomycetota bacterium]
MLSLKVRVRRFVRQCLGIEFGSRHYFRSYELAQDLGELIDRCAVDAILDVGANRGQFRHFLRRCVGYRGLICSFEPVRVCQEELRPQVARDPRWFLYEFALGRGDGTGTLHVSRDSRGSSFLDATRETYGVPLQQDHDEEVPIRSLESVFPELQKTHGFERPHLKLDTQGYDLQVIRGAGPALQACVALQTEISFLPIYEGMADYATSLAEIKGHGFDVAGFYPAARDEAGRAIEMDCLLVRSSAAAPAAPRRADPL